MEGRWRLQLMLYFLCCHLLIQEKGERGEASDAGPRLIITLENLAAPSRPAHLKCSSVSCHAAAL